MAKPTIADLALFINRQIQINDKIATYLWHLEALMDVVLSINFFELDKSTMHYYFSAVADLIKDMLQLNQANLILLHEQ